MPIPVVCPSCNNSISAPDHVAGRTLRCFKCLNPFTVPNVKPMPAAVAPMAQLAPSYSAPPDEAPAFTSPAADFSMPPPLAEFPADIPPPPTDTPMPPLAAPIESTGPDPFELTQEEPAWDATAPAATPEELPSTQDMPMEEAAMELAPTDEFNPPAEEAPVEEVSEEVAEEPVGPQKSRMVATLLAFFLPFSIHRFYLGYTKSGTLQLLLWFVLIGWVWQVFDFLRLLLGVGFKKDGRGVPLR